MQEAILETKTCKQCSIHFDITQDDRDFYMKISPSFGGEKYQIPDPTLCPECRQQRRLAWRNERKLYKRKCDATGRDTISVYSPDKKNKVYSGESWWSDQWDGVEYGMNMDFGESFFTQFSDLLKKVPRMSIISKGCENSEYGNNNFNDKDCYLLFLSGDNERCYYGYAVGFSKSCTDTLWNIQSDSCYESTKIEGCYLCFYCENISQCSESIYLSYCKGVSHSCFCSGIRNKQYCILNKQYKKKDYLDILGMIHSNKEVFEEYYREYLSLKKSLPKASNNIQTEDCIGDSLSHCQKCNYCYDLIQSQNCKFSYDACNIQDCYDYYLGGSDIVEAATARCYESENNSACYDVSFSSTCWGKSNNLLYCDSCMTCSNCFACVGLKHKKYCILNTQYTKEEYEERVPEIINYMITTGEWGEFFPAQISQFGYNETVAQEYFPLTKEVAGEASFNWSDYEAPLPKVDKIISALKLPENISDIPDDILNWAIECEVTKKPFRIIRQELEFYRKHKLPIPKRHPDQRRIDRITKN